MKGGQNCLGTIFGRERVWMETWSGLNLNNVSMDKERQGWRSLFQTHGAGWIDRGKKSEFYKSCKKFEAKGSSGFFEFILKHFLPIILLTQN